MADNAPERDALPVGESYRKDFKYEVEIFHVSPLVYNAKIENMDNWTGEGPTEDIALARAVLAMGGTALAAAAQEYADSPKDGTRQVVGNDVSSEQLRDTYLGGKDNG